MPFSTDSKKDGKKSPFVIISPFFFKQGARIHLRGDLQTALLITLMVSIWGTLASLITQLVLQNVQSLSESFYYAMANVYASQSVTATQQQQLWEVATKLLKAIADIPSSTWVAMFGLDALALLLTPILSVCSCRYYIRRMDGETPSLGEAVTGRLRIWYKSLGLYALMALKILLWGLLFVIPGIIAYCRYSMAPYFLAEDPTLSPSKAIAKSKEMMAHQKASYFLLKISFVFLTLLISLVQMFISDFSSVAAMVVALCADLLVNVYMDASCAAFYTTLGRRDGVETLVGHLKNQMRQMGADDETIASFAKSASRQFGTSAEDDTEDSEDDSDTDNTSDEDLLD